MDKGDSFIPSSWVCFLPERSCLVIKLSGFVGNALSAAAIRRATQIMQDCKSVFKKECFFFHLLLFYSIEESNKIAEVSFVVTMEVQTVRIKVAVFLKMDCKTPKSFSQKFLCRTIPQKFLPSPSSIIALGCDKAKHCIVSYL